MFIYLHIFNSINVNKLVEYVYFPEKFSYPAHPTFFSIKTKTLTIEGEVHRTEFLKVGAYAPDDHCCTYYLRSLPLKF